MDKVKGRHQNPRYHAIWGKKWLRSEHGVSAGACRWETACGSGRRGAKVVLRIFFVAERVGKAGWLRAGEKIVATGSRSFPCRERSRTRMRGAGLASDFGASEFAHAVDLFTTAEVYRR